MSSQQPWRQHIEFDETCLLPKVIGTDIHPLKIVALIAMGYTFESIIHVYPELNQEQIQACVEYGKDKASEAYETEPEAVRKLAK